MASNIIISKNIVDENFGDLEIIERKGIGHPDTVADALAENTSVAYSKYTLKNFGAILHHNFDKLSVLGGKTDVTWGKGIMVKPVRVILNGRASTSFADQEIPVQDILEKEVKRYLKQLFSNVSSFDVNKDVTFQYNVSNASGPGKIRESKGSRAFLFEPRKVSDVKGYDKLLNNDTSIGCGYAPLSPLENAILQLEGLLNAKDFKTKHPWLGTDIKIMGSKINDSYDVTLCLPQIAEYVNSAEEYKKNNEDIKVIIMDFLVKSLKTDDIRVNINTRDNYDKNDYYLTAIGSSIEAGDEGIVGRGNRVNGLITPFRPMNLEGACGKNPKYYTGKLYNVAAHQIAAAIYNMFKVQAQVFLVSQAGREIIDPWKVFVKLEENNINVKDLEALIKTELKKIPDLTDKILEKKIQLY